MIGDVLSHICRKDSPNGGNTNIVAHLFIYLVSFFLPFSLFYKYVHLFFSSDICLCMYVAHRIQKKTLNTLELKLHAVVAANVGAKNQTLVT